MPRPRKPIGRKRPIMVAAVVERSDGSVLICRPKGDPELPGWVFPGGLSDDNESPEAAVCRLSHLRAGVQIEVLVGQPPLAGRYAGREVECRYFLCGLASGEGQPKDYDEVRWVAKAQLCEYDFEPPADEVARWLAE
ncbi:MAG: NUDIX domain-containing protein [Phycisphaerae bacterium]